VQLQAAEARVQAQKILLAWRPREAQALREV